MGTNKLAPGGTEKNTAWIGVDGGDGNEGATGTSIFDPTLCELVYRWFCFPRGRVLDPFAGGSVRGIVAALLGLFYTGVELSKGQIAANRKQAKEIVKAGANGWCGSPNLGRVQWVEGDAAKVESLARDKYDLIFSCPPYGNLEVYSEDPRDLSTMPHDAFLAAYRAIIAACVRMLKPERFACFVVGDYRDKVGYYQNFVSDTIAAFQDAGMRLYNEAILVTAVGSLPIRVGTAFGKYRKLGKTHQQVLVFYNGDPAKILDNFPAIKIESESGKPDEAAGS